MLEADGNGHHPVIRFARRGGLRVIVPTFEWKGESGLTNRLYRILFVRFVHFVGHDTLDEGVETVEVGVTAVAPVHQNTLHCLPMTLDIKKRLVAVSLCHQQ